MRIAIIAAAFVVAGCAEQVAPTRIAADACANAIKQSLRAPSTYTESERSSFFDPEKGTIKVFITYEGQNLMGGKVQSIDTCAFDFKAGENTDFFHLREASIVENGERPSDLFGVDVMSHIHKVARKCSQAPTASRCRNAEIEIW